jgi:hypothetical protein
VKKYWFIVNTSPSNDVDPLDPWILSNHRRKSWGDHDKNGRGN